MELQKYWTVLGKLAALVNMLRIQLHKNRANTVPVSFKRVYAAAKCESGAVLLARRFCILMHGSSQWTKTCPAHV